VTARILVADDDRKLASLVRTYLERAGHVVVTVHDGRSALTECRRRRPDLAILDIMMPLLDGQDVCHVLRAESEIPVIFLTARSTEDDLVGGLKLGADDYVTKPFSPRELVARVEAVLRRAGGPAQPSVMTAGQLVLDESRHQVTLDGVPVECTPAEFRILRELVARPGHVFTRTQLLESAFGFDHDALERTIDAHVMNLRRKLEPDPGEPRHLVTVYGVGYKFVLDEAAG
jgi:DNA-binding response OmpR family regulator